MITEICQWAGSSTGRPAGGKPSYLSDDYVEITADPNVDLAGYVLEIWISSTKRVNYTIPAGTFTSPDGTATFSTIGGAASPTNFHYVAGNASRSSGTASGQIIKDATGTIIDAVGYSSYSFPTAAGVSSSDWSGTNVSGSSSWGIRLTGADNNDRTNWVKATQKP